jgi:hypothetical protein
MNRRPPARFDSLRVLLAAGALALALVPAARAGTPGTRLDPRLLPALVAGSEAVPVWVEFADKGESGPSDLAAKLAAAEANLTPEARRRRERAGMNPLVDWLDLPIEPGYVEALKAGGFAPYGQSRWFNGCVVRTSGDALARLATLPFVRTLAPAPLTGPRRGLPQPVEEAVPAPRTEGAFSATRTMVAYGQTATQLARLGVPALHDSGYVGAGVLICMLDEGFNYYNKHEATRDIDVGNRTRDFIDGDASVQDTTIAPGIYQHGEWTLSAIGGNKPGRYVGPAFGARFALARTENSASEKPIEMVFWSMGAEWADSLGADIISSSLGYTTFPDSAGYDIIWPMLNGHTALITRAAEIAASRGILVVNSAGNDGNAFGTGSKISAPSDANGDSVLCIGALDSLGIRASYSSKGPTYDQRIKPDLVAQGSSVLLASPGGGATQSAWGQYTRLSGTSFACPLTAGLAACFVQARPRWPMPLIIRALRETASHASNPDTLTGYGLPNGLAAMLWVPDTIGVPPGGTDLSFALQGANPVRADAWPIALHFALGAGAAASQARVRVYDMQGRVIATPWSGPLAPGSSATVAWDGQTGRGPLGPGLYFLAFETGGRRITRRLVSLR